MSSVSGLLGHHLDGAGPEVVLPLNGGMMTWAAWGTVTEALRPDYRVLACDLRGQLRSPGPGHPRLADHVPDLLALLDALELDSVHVLGASFGGEIAVLLAAAAPSRVRSLAVVTAADRTPPGMRESAVRLQVLAGQVLAGGDAGPFRDAVEEGVYSPEYRQSHAELLATRRRHELPLSWYEGLLGILDSIQDFDLTDALGQISCPTLVVRAAHDEVMPEARSRPLVEGIANAELRIHPTAGHALVIEDPAWLATTYRQFLARHAVTR